MALEPRHAVDPDGVGRFRTGKDAKSLGIRGSGGMAEGREEGCATISELSRRAGWILCT